MTEDERRNIVTLNYRGRTQVLHPKTLDTVTVHHFHGPRNALDVFLAAVGDGQYTDVFYPASAAEMAELASAVLAAEGVEYFVSLDGKAITCAKCRKTSFNAHDVANR